MKTPFNEILGKIYNKNSDTFKNVYNAKIVLIKDKNFLDGYRVLTGFPVDK